MMNSQSDETVILLSLEITFLLPKQSQSEQTFKEIFNTLSVDFTLVFSLLSF